jgi:hypothetical protein
MFCCDSEVGFLTKIHNPLSNKRDKTVAKLKSLKKKNMMKFLIKQGFEVNDWVMNSPVEVINKLTMDPVINKVFEKHDTSQDSNIIVSIHNRIQVLEAEMQDMVKETHHLDQEISKLDKKLVGRKNKRINFPVLISLVRYLPYGRKDKPTC